MEISDLSNSFKREFTKMLTKVRRAMKKVKILRRGNTFSTYQTEIIELKNELTEMKNQQRGSTVD